MPQNVNWQFPVPISTACVSNKLRMYNKMSSVKSPYYQQEKHQEAATERGVVQTIITFGCKPSLEHGMMPSSQETNKFTKRHTSPCREASKSPRTYTNSASQSTFSRITGTCGRGSRNSLATQTCRHLQTPWTAPDWHSAAAASGQSHPLQSQCVGSYWSRWSHR